MNHFCKILEALTLNETLTYIDLSQNNLDDKVSDALLELIAVLPYLKYLNLEHNKLQSLEWGKILAMNSSLQELHLSFNNLNFKSLESLLESITVNKTLKVLSLLECEKSEEFYENISKLLAEVLQHSFLSSLIIEIDENCKNLEDLAKTMVEANTELIEFSIGDQWKTACSSLKTIWGAVQANKWILYKLHDPSEDFDIDSDIEQILELKLNRLKELETGPRIKIEENVEIHVDPQETPQFSSYTSGKQFRLDQAIEGLDKAEDELIAQAYNTPQDDLIEDKSLISISVFNDSPRNFTYSESSNTGTPILESPRMANDKVEAKFRNIQRQIRSVDDRVIQSSEFLKDELNILAQTFHEFELSIAKNQKNLEKTVETIRENNKKSGLKDSALDKIIAGLENRILILEKVEENRRENLVESRRDLEASRESYRELVLRVEKYELNTKLQMSSMKKSFCKKHEITNLQEKQTSLNGELQSLNTAVNQIDSQVEKLKQLAMSLQKTEKIIQKKKEEQDNVLIELKQKITQVEQKFEDLPNANLLISNVQKDIDNKITRLEIKVWDTLDADAKKESNLSSLRTFDKKLHIIDEKVNKMFESIKELSKEIVRFESFKVLENFERLEKQISQSPTRKIVVPQQEKRLLRSTETYDNLRSTLLRNTYTGKRPNSCVRPLTNLYIPKQDESYKSMPEKLAETDTFTLSNLKDSQEVEFMPEKTNKIGRSELRKLEIGEFLPGEAESIVMNAIIEKANKSRVPQMRKSFSSINLSPVVQGVPTKTQPQFAKYTDDTSPSIELQESLKLRGINI